MILKQGLTEGCKLSVMLSIERPMGLSRRFWKDKVICNFLGKSFREEQTYLEEDGGVVTSY